MTFHKAHKLFTLLVMYLTFEKILAASIDLPKLDLIILHNNDMHARFEQTGVNSNKCESKDAAANKCYGGFARTAHEIRKFREEAKAPGGIPVLYLNAGDTYTGTPWFTIFKDNITATFLNLLKPDAISLGNHEFDEGVEGLIPFLNEVDFPVLTCNLDMTKTPELAATKSLKNSHVFNVNGFKIGVIGYLTSDTKKLAKPNNVEFYDEVESINKEAKRLKTEGVQIIIALGHSGYDTDQKIGRECPEVDLVIGGHTNTFLYNGNQPSVEVPVGPYPQVVKQKSGKKVPVVQAYAYTKYLGYLKLKFDNKGNLIEWNGEPILLNGTIPEDSDILDVLNLYRPKITRLEKDTVGRTKVMLEGKSQVCRVQECNLGNLVADSMVYARVNELKDGSPDGYWTDAAIAFVGGGGIRSSIDKKADGSITRNDILTVLPFDNDLFVVNVTGQTILDSLEHSAQNFDHPDSNGGFLQMSGVHVNYDLQKPAGKRVTNVEVLCADCNIPTYSKLDVKKTYNIIITTFLMSGGDGYSFKMNKSSDQKIIKMQLDDFEAATDYIVKRSPVYPSVEWRITFGPAGSTKPANSSPSIVGGSSMLLFISLLLSKL